MYIAQNKFSEKKSFDTGQATFQASQLSPSVAVKSPHQDFFDHHLWQELKIMVQRQAGSVQSILETSILAHVPQIPPSNDEHLNQCLIILSSVSTDQSNNTVFSTVHMDKIYIPFVPLLQNLEIFTDLSVTPVCNICI